MKRFGIAYNLFFSHFERSILYISRVFEILVLLASINCLFLLIVSTGYDLADREKHIISVVMRCTQALFALYVAYGWIFRFKATLRQSRIIKWIVDFALLLTVLAAFCPNPENPWIKWLDALLYSKKFLYSVLGAFSLVEICYALSRIPNRRTNPALLMASSFLFFIIIGSLVLMLPRSTYHGISYFDSLFVSSSAVCITGLTSVDISSTFTPFGILVLSVLVQLGSLGLITFTSFFAIFFSGNTSIYNQLLLRDVIYSKSMNSLVPTLLYVLSFTLSVELIGAAAVYFTIPETLGMDVEQKLIFASFHSMSSFCNAGFSCLPHGMSNPALMQSDQNIYLVTSVLIMAGAVGFPILVNFKELVKSWIMRLVNCLRYRKSQGRVIHISNLNTKLVLSTTVIILCIGTVGFYLLEGDNTLRGMSTYQKWVQSLFNALIPRSAGFASVNPVDFLDVTLVLVLVQMFIGGSSQSMAGGIKVNTVAVIWLNLRAVLRGYKRSAAYNRTVGIHSVRRAHAVVTISILALLAYIVAMMLMNPQFSAKQIVFESVSALFTVGSSLGITPYISDGSKVLLCTAMFLGRVGIVSLLGGFMSRTRDLSSHLPAEDVIIN